MAEPHPERLPPGTPAYDEIIRVHRAALADGADSYVDPSTGLSVLTAEYLARRGFCCESGCRHCPYLV